ncbi:MAG: TPM domain-containing protein, partial [Actinomycetota bacterium]|nr:TPM domain-containing protein [Actinomycetota bacterium]
MRGLLAGIAVVVSVLLPASAALGEPPLRVPDQVTDRVGALDGRETEVEVALDDVRADTGIQVFAVYVSSFDGRSGDEWANETARVSQLGGNDVLLAVAVDDRAYGYSVDESFPISDAALEQLVTGDVEPRLAEEDWAGAAVVMADGLRGTSADGGLGAGSPPA